MTLSARRATGHGATALLLFAVLGAVLLAAPASATSVPLVIVVEVPESSLADLVASPPLRALIGAGTRGGASLMVGSATDDPIDELDAALEGTAASDIEAVRLRSIDELAPVLSTMLADPDGGRAALVLVFTTPGHGDPRWLGSVALAEGDARAMRVALETGRGPAIDQTLTSDSTHRVGVVTSADVATTAIVSSAAEPVDAPEGSPIDVVDAPPPIGLYERYVQQRRLAIPVGTATGLYAFVVGAFGLVVLFGRVPSPRLRAVAASGAISVVPLAAALMLVGHLERLTYPTVIACLVAVTLVSVAALVLARRARGPLAAIAALGLGVLGVFVVEAWLRWTAALTPLLGGAQLDGGRFFGLPNVQIGLLMGASLYVAQRLAGPPLGVALILGVALFAGLPWTGSNIGAAVTIAAAAGLWWGLRVDEGRLRPRTALRVLATVAGTLAIVVMAHRYLTDAPTHISRFASDTGGVAGLWERFADRLAVGADLIARNPFGLVPVVGVLGTLWLVLRPPPALRPSLGAHPAWRDALVTILLGSVIAYVANDSGAAAIGLGFGTALGGLLYVSLSEPPAKMEGP